MDILTDLKRTIRGIIGKDNLWQEEDANKLKQLFNSKLSLARKKRPSLTIKKFKI